MTYQRNGRTISSRQFFDGLKDDAIELTMSAIIEDMRGKAAAIVDPETGKHAAVMMRRIGSDRLLIHADAAMAFARMLEGCLGLRLGWARQC